MHRSQRDGAAWFTEWLTLPQLVLSTASAARCARALSTQITAQDDRMAANLEASGGAIYAEALCFALTGDMPRPEAQSAVKELCLRAQDEDTSLEALARARWPDADLSDVFAGAGRLGQAPADARAFAQRVRATAAT